MILLIKKCALFCLILLCAQILFSLSWKIEKNLETGRARGITVSLPETYIPEPEILLIQDFMNVHPTVGFLWKENIDTTDEIILGWGDIPAGALVTDEYGFVNTPEAIDMRRSGIPVDIVGLGASYMGGAQGLFQEYFALKGMSFYNMSHGRHTLPQFNTILKEYASPLKPRWVVYGLNEVSYTLIPDFEQWRASGLDWFTYHSGTWCGPPPKKEFPHPQLRKYPKVYKLYHGMMKSLFRSGLPGKRGNERDMLLDKTFSYIIDAQRYCNDNDIGFILLFIPARERMTGGPSPSWFLFELLGPRLLEAGVPFIDLREKYAAVENPASLYFQFDNHWNRQGVYIAAREILAHIAAHAAPVAGKGE